MTAVTTRPRFLTTSDFAVKVTAAGSVPTRTSPPDEIALWHLANRTLLVDTEAGEVYRADGVTRAERPDVETGFGKVYLGRIAGRVRFAQAHRVVWIARHGPIPGMYEIAHRNGHRWDNRLANLALTTRSESMRRANGSLWIHVDPGPDDRPTIKPYTTAQTYLTKPARMNRRNVP